MNCSTNNIFKPGHTGSRSSSPSQDIRSWLLLPHRHPVARMGRVRRGGRDRRRSSPTPRKWFLAFRSARVGTPRPHLRSGYRARRRFFQEGQGEKGNAGGGWTAHPEHGRQAQVPAWWRRPLARGGLQRHSPPWRRWAFLTTFPRDHSKNLARVHPPDCYQLLGRREDHRPAGPHEGPRLSANRRAPGLSFRHGRPAHAAEQGAGCSRRRRRRLDWFPKQLRQSATITRGFERYTNNVNRPVGTPHGREFRSPSTIECSISRKNKRADTQGVMQAIHQPDLPDRLNSGDPPAQV